MNRCLSTLQKRKDEGYSARALRRLADRKKFPRILEFSRDEVIDIRSKTIDRMSISGVREKLSLRLERGRLRPVSEGGQYILKPVPNQALPRFQKQVPANEHLTMQLAEQIWELDTAANSCIRLADGELAYVTRRFDRQSDGTPIPQEDFCQLTNRTPDTSGTHYKYTGSYRELADALRDYCAAYVIESQKLFRRIVFNYLVANGDAHLKNFSLQKTGSFGDYLLTPAYDLLCTKLHIPEDSRLALDLFKNDEYPKGVMTHGFVTGGDLIDLGERIGLSKPTAREVVDRFCRRRDEAKALVDRSFLSEEAKQVYHAILEDRWTALELRAS